MHRTRPSLRLDISRAAALTLAAVIIAACGAGPGATIGPNASGVDRLTVVATTTVLADFVHEVGGDLVDVSSLVPKGGEVHTFDPSPEQATIIAQAELIVMNGVGLDEWLADLVASSGSPDVKTVELAEDLEGVTYIQDDDHAEGEPGHSEEPGHAEGVNPHLWMDVTYAQRYIEKLAQALADIDPDHATTYSDRAADYTARLTILDTLIKQGIDQVPAQNRRVISFHEAFPYFAAAYGLEIVGTVLDAPGQEPSAGEVAALIEAVRSEGAKAILAESQFPDDLVQTISAETGVTIVSDLYTDSLGDAPVDTYLGMMEWDAERIVAALR